MQPHKLGHILAISGTLAVHGGIAAWAMQPSPPVAIPQQQVIQVAMITSPVAQEKIEIIQEQPAPIILPKYKGMVKVPEKKKAEVKKEPEREEKKIEQLATAVLASGPQSIEAQAKNAAITEPLFNAEYLRNPAPEYPPLARRQKIQGKVLLKVNVTKDGTAKSVIVHSSSGHKVLDEAAREAVELWHFVPARRGSETVEANVIVPVIFQIGEKG